MARTKNPVNEAERRAAIVEASYELLTQMPYRAMTLNTVATAIGVSKGLVSYYFPSKDTLLLATVDHFFNVYGTELRTIAADVSPIPMRLRRLVEVMLPERQILRKRAGFIAEVSCLAKSNDAVRASLQQALLGLRDACRALLEVGAREGYVTATVDEELLSILMGLVDGLALQVVALPAADIAAVRKCALRTLDVLVRRPSHVAGAAPRQDD